MIAENKEKLKALISGAVESVTIAGVTITKIDVAGYKYQLKGGSIRVYGDALLIAGVDVLITLKELIIAAVPLTS